jgi:type III secretion system YscD/HrpQ family protein
MAKYLIAEEGLLKGLLFILEDKEEYKIGRDPDLVDFVLEDPSCSREHALIFKEDGEFFITDLSHTNPTSINGNALTDAYLMKEGDRVQIGKTIFKYSSNKPEKEEVIPEEKVPDEYSPIIESKPGDETIFEGAKEEVKEEKKEGQLEETKLNLEEEQPKEEEQPQLTTEEEKRDQEQEEKKESPEEKNIESIATTPEGKEPDSYDTIFEEETSEEHPFNIVTENSLILKVISGSNAGAEFGMDRGKSYILGKDPSSCNIVFNDLSVSKEHAKITVEEDGSCYIEDLDSRNGVIVNSKKIDKKRQITSKDIIALGSTIFVVIDPLEAQETLYAPLAGAYEVTTEAVAEKEAPGEEEKATDWRKLIIPKNHLIIASSFILVLFVIFLTFFSLFRSEKIEIAPKDPVKEIKKALEKFPGVQFSFNPAGGNLFLIGHVLTAIDQQELTYNINAIPFIDNIENNIIIDEYVWKNTNDLLSSNPLWRSVNVHSYTPGLFVASGYVQSPQQMEALANYLKTNFPYVDKLQNKVVIEDVLKTEIEGMIISRGLSAISYELASGELILAGRYAMDDEKSYQKLLDELKKLDGIRSIKNAAIKTTPDMARIDLTGKYKISGIVTSDHNKIISVVANSRLINLNGFLDGMKVTEIKPNTIYLEKDGLKYKIDYIR